MKLTDKKVRYIKPKKSLFTNKEASKITAFLFLLMMWNGLATVAILILLANNNKLANEKTVFVQQMNGETIVAQEKSENYRSDEVIRLTIAKWLPMMWEWDSFIPGTRVIDEGMSVGTGGERFKVPTQVYIASYLLEPRLRWEYLKTMAKEIPQEFYQDRVRSVFEIQYLGKPIRKEDGRYEIGVIASRTDINETNQEQRSARFEKTIVLKAIEPYKSVDAETSPFKKQLEALLYAGLMVIEIKDIELD